MEQQYSGSCIGKCPREQMKQPFWISNLNTDTKEHYISANPQTTSLQLLTQQNANGQNQLWTIEHVKDQFFTIRNAQLYLTLDTNTSHQNGHGVNLAPRSQDSPLQHWSFQMGQNKRFFVRVRHEAKIFHLESVKSENGSNVLLCRHPAAFQARFLQFWRLSPYKEQIILPDDNREGLIQSSPQDIRTQLERFKGKIYSQTHPWYAFAVHTYSFSSLAVKPNPFYLTYPKDVEDIKVMITISKTLKKKIVARSGGHQYSGMSSGNNDTIILILNQFNTLRFNQEGLIELGPANKLKDVSKFLQSNKITIPHGECPLVNVGGHCQTGGYGHLLRCFGIFADYCEGFDIVLSDGELKHIKKPSEANKDDRLNFQIYRGVLGGNAGSFGIVVKYYLSYIKDSEYPNSYGFQKIRYYSEELFRLVMGEFKAWTESIGTEKEKDLEGLDLFFTVSQASDDITQAKEENQIIILEALSRDNSKPEVLIKLLNKFMKGITPAEILLNGFIGTFDGPKPISYIAHKGVRSYPLIGPSGRQFDLPYQKRANVTYNPLEQTYIDKVAEQINLAFESKKLYLIIQGFPWGGAYKLKGDRSIDNLSITSFPRRNAVFCLVYDLFYAPTGKEQAKEGQEVMGKIVQEHFNGTKGDKKIFWGSYGDVDMTKPQVISAYYDSLEDYRWLQTLKEKVDKDDVFHTPMTVKLP